MKIFLDTADMNEIVKWSSIIDGVTTNPTILKKQHLDLKKFADTLFPMPVSLEVTTDDLSEMLQQAQYISDLSPNVVVKIPVENQYGQPTYTVIKQLERSGIRVNATAVMSFGQVMLAAKVGATYISIFAGRIGDEGGFPEAVISQSVEWLRRWEYRNQIIVGSIRSVGDVLRAATAGAHIITIPPDILAKMADHKYTRETVRQFIEDSK
jgi:transaldolase